MKLDQKTITVLKSFASINPSILFKEGDELTTISPTKTIMAKAKVPTKFPRRFAIYNLGRFLSTISLFNDPELTFEDTRVKISDGTSRSLNYTYADEVNIKTPPEKKLELPSVEVEFKISTDQIRDVEKALGVLGLPEIAIGGDGKEIFIAAIDSKLQGGDVYSLRVGDTDKNFKVFFKSENIKILPGEYTVQISSRGISRFFNDETEYFVAVESHSTFG
jgi:hypothetical protein